MDLNKLYSSKRTGVDQTDNFNDPRSRYQKDYDHENLDFSVTYD